MEQVIDILIQKQTWDKVNSTRMYHNRVHVQRALRAADRLIEYFSEQKLAIMAQQLGSSEEILDNIIQLLNLAILGHDIDFDLDDKGNPLNSNELSSFMTLDFIMQSRRMDLLQAENEYLKTMILHTIVSFHEPSLVLSADFSQNPEIAFSQILIEICDKANSFIFKDVFEDELEWALTMNILLQFEIMLRKQYALFGPDLSHHFCKKYCLAIADDLNISKIVFDRAVTGFINYTNSSIIENLKSRFDSSVLATSSTMVDFVDEIITLNQHGVKEFAKYTNADDIFKAKMIYQSLGLVFSIE